MIVDIAKLKDIIEIQFSEIVEDVVLTDINELRIVLIDGSFISDNPESALKEFLSFASERIKKEEPPN